MAYNASASHTLVLRLSLRLVLQERTSQIPSFMCHQLKKPYKLSFSYSNYDKYYNQYVIWHIPNTWLHAKIYSHKQNKKYQARASVNYIKKPKLSTISIKKYMYDHFYILQVQTNTTVKKIYILYKQNFL